MYIFINLLIKSAIVSAPKIMSPSDNTVCDALCKELVSYLGVVE